MKNINSYNKLEELGRVRLSSNFFMRDFLYSEIAAWHGLRNVPDHPEQAIYAGTQLCEQLLEPLQTTFGRVHVRSGYRSPEVNAYGNANDLNCASNEANYAGHIWDYPNALGKRGATACIVLPWLVDHIERGGSWTDMAWWIHDHLPYGSLYFFPKLAAFNINWNEEPQRRVDSYAEPKGCLIRPGTQGAPGLHGDHYAGFPAMQHSVLHLKEVIASQNGNDNQDLHLTAKEIQKLPPANSTKPSLSQASPVKSNIFYRAVHVKTRWRKVNCHSSMWSAIDGPNGATGLFSGKVRIDYEKHGEPLFVLVWQSGSDTGFAIRQSQGETQCLQKVQVSVGKLLEFEHRQGGDFHELTSLFD